MNQYIYTLAIKTTYSSLIINVPRNFSIYSYIVYTIWIMDIYTTIIDI